MTILTRVISSSHLWSFLQNFSWYLRRDRDIDFFFCPTDPHSYLAFQALGIVVANQYPSVVIRIWLCGPAKEAGLEAYAASPEEQEAWQLRDARYLANLYKDIGIKYDPKITGFNPKLRLVAIQACLKITQDRINSDGSFVLGEELYKQIMAVEELIYSGNEQALQSASEGVSEESAKRCIENSAAAILRKGHFNTGFIRFGYEYFWGIDRLGYLEQQLINRGLAAAGPSTARPVFVRTHKLVMHRSPASKSIIDPSQVVVEMFWSFRSPYSQVVLKQIFALVDAYRVRLSLRLVLPMVMRGLSVPVAKQVYILYDTSREARLQNVEFGNCADPVGAGVERAFAVFQIARRENKEREFLLSWARCVWAQNVVADSDEGIWRVAREAGLKASRSEVIRVAKEDSGESASWRKEVEANRTRLYELGLWGVPSFAFEGDQTFALWGQDRLFQLEMEIIQRLEGKTATSPTSSQTFPSAL